MKKITLLRRCSAALAIVGMIAGSVDAAQGEWSARSLMMKLAEVKEAELTFVERRTSGFLVEEIELTGTLKYQAPDRIEKSVQTPFIENILIHGDNLSVEKVSGRGEKSVKNYSLNAYEVLSTTVAGIRATISGNLSVLEKSYDIELGGDMADWSVLLTPKHEEIRGHIEKIMVRGSEEQIKVIETFDADGDESRIHLSYQTIK